MPTDIIKKVGASNSPVTMDYSTVQTWNDAAPADLTVANERWIGECYNQGTLVAESIIGNGSTVDSTRYFWLRTAAGASFRDNASVRSNALYLNASNGVTLQNNDSYNPTLKLNASYTTLSDLQIQNLGVNSTIRNNSTPTTTDSCILSSAATAGGVLTGGSIMYNTIVISVGTNNGSIMGFFSNTCFFYSCTFVATGTGGTAFPFLNYGQGFLQNCAVFGFATLFTGAATSLAAGSDYNATDLATSFGTGTHNLNSLTYASQFVNSTNDYRAVSTGSLKAGVPDATHTPIDITGVTRSATTPYIGCWEVASAGPVFVAKPGFTIQHAVKRGAYY